MIDNFVLLCNSTAKPKARNVGDHSPIFADTDQRVALKCEAEGWPKPHISWLKDDKNISFYKKKGYYIKEIPTEGNKIKSITSKLIIVAAQTYNSGKFTCVAVNAIGVFKYNITVDVRGKKYFYLFIHLFIFVVSCFSVSWQ